MKKIVSLFLVILFLSAATAPAYALSEEKALDGIITPRFVAISLLYANLSIDSGGNATAEGQVRPADSTYTSYLTVSLQKYVGGGWLTIRSWTSSNTGLSGVYINESYSVDSGLYRSRSIARIYNSGGTLLETATLYSNTCSY